MALNIVLLGDNSEKKSVIQAILESPTTECVKEDNGTPKVINDSDFSDRDLRDQHIINLMALSYPGPDVFLLVLDEGQKPEEELEKWEQVIQQSNMLNNTIFIMNKNELSKDSKVAHKCVDFNKEGLYEECKQIWDKHIHKPYKYTYSNYSEAVVKARFENDGTAIKKARQEADGMREGSQSYQQEGAQLTLVLLGESGSGKSASGNTILGEKRFESRPSSMPVTTKCNEFSKVIKGSEVKVIDTPDFFDDEFHIQSNHVNQCIHLCDGSLCVFLLVIQLGRFTVGERDILERLERALDTRVRDKAIILFTHGDDLDRDIDDYLKGTDKHLQALIKKCGGRYQVINNKDETEANSQMKELMSKVSQLVQKLDTPNKDTSRHCIVS